MDPLTDFSLRVVRDSPRFPITRRSSTVNSAFSSARKSKRTRNSYAAMKSATSCFASVNDWPKRALFSGIASTMNAGTPDHGVPAGIRRRIPV